MADTRCADPELQLDVDVMILEYTLFQAVEAQFQTLLDRLQEDVKRSRALRTVSTFDYFIQIFNQHHPTYEHPPEFDFRLDILEFLVLLSSLLSGYLTVLPEGMLKGLQERVEYDLKPRRRWLAHRERQFRRLEKRPAMSSSTDVNREVEMQIYAVWSSSETTSPYPTSQTTEALLHFSLLPRFIIISAKFLQVIEQVPNKSWMEVACELMLRASLESLRLQTQDCVGFDVPTLEECFAWGYIDSGGIVAGNVTALCDEELSELINDLFRAPADAEPIVDEENPDWTRPRFDTVSEFSIAADASLSSQGCRLERLADKYPLEAFQQKLIGALQNIWELSCRDYIFGKPVLADIEEGHLKSFGIEGPQFDEFAATVGLNSSFEDGGDHVVTSTVEDYEVDVVAKRYDIFAGLVSEQSLTERYDYERDRLRRVSGYLNGKSLAIKLEC